MSDLSKRVAGLTPGKRLLLERLLQAQTPLAPLQTAAAQSPKFVSWNGTTDIGGATAGSSRRKAELADSQLAFQPTSSPAAMKDSCKHFYNAVSEQLDSSDFGAVSFFLNYGYLPDRNPQYAQVQLPDRYLNKNSVKLVLEMLGDCMLSDRSVLDVGCGRGGTISVIRKFFAPKYIVGIDLASTAISFCKRTHRYDSVSFLEGDAERLPFRDESFQVVTNLESSHSYPNMEAFYLEVFRVLTPGGHFLYADVLPAERVKECAALLKDIGFIVEREQDITRNVILSCDEVATTRIQAFDGQSDRGTLDEFLGVPGSEVYDDMKVGRSRYSSLKLRKSEASASVAR